jgi:hypothetical protein
MEMGAVAAWWDTQSAFGKRGYAGWSQSLVAGDTKL